MPSRIRSLDAHQYLRAKMTADSWRIGWRSLLLRAYVDPPLADEFNTPPTADHLIVLVTEGVCDIEGRYHGRWRKAHYSAGSLGMTAPGEEVSLRWSGSTQHKTLQLHLPPDVIDDALGELSRANQKRPEMPHRLLAVDPMIEQAMLGLAGAMAANAPDLYAETAANFLAMHLVVRHGDCRVALPPARDDRRLRRVEAFMRENLGAPLSLADMAREAGVSRFHLLRIFKNAYGETPLRSLTRIRMEEAQRRLEQGGESIGQIAFACGYGNPGHFAAAFRRVVGVAPGAWRRGCA
jgi:AraC family transcriptional regulator